MFRHCPKVFLDFVGDLGHQSKKQLVAAVRLRRQSPYPMVHVSQQLCDSVGRSFVNDDPVFRTCKAWQIATGPANCEARSLPGWADHRYRRRGGFEGCSHHWCCRNAFRGGHAAPKSRSAAGSCANARCHAYGHAHASHECPPDADAHASHAAHAVNAPHAAHAVNAPHAAYAVNAPHAANAAHAAHAAVLLSTEQHAALWLSYVQAVLRANFVSF